MKIAWYWSALYLVGVTCFLLLVYHLPYVDVMKFIIGLTLVSWIGRRFVRWLARDRRTQVTQ